jgi:transmembrane sensor
VQTVGCDSTDTMSNVHRFPRKSERYDQASAWIAKLDRGLSENEIVELRAWICADRENAVVLLSMSELWDDMDLLSCLADLFPVPVHRRRRFPLTGFGVAAALVVAAVLASWAGFEVSPLTGPLTETEKLLVESSQGVYETAIGEQTTVILSDGTLVVLNTNSLLRVAFTDGYRLLTLERGEVNVRVARDPSRPLSVVAGDQVFQAIGTAFNVEINEDQRIELVVTEGKVRVGVQERTDKAPPRLLEESAVTVSAGEELILGENGAEITPVSPEEIEVKLSWRNGDLIFRGESLEEAVREVGRYTSVEFVILAEDLKKVRVAGWFKAGDVEGLLLTLRENFDIAYERIDERTVVLDSP